jgi:hypothetical protein
MMKSLPVPWYLEKMRFMFKCPALKSGCSLAEEDTNLMNLSGNTTIGKA